MRSALDVDLQQKGNPYVVSHFRADNAALKNKSLNPGSWSHKISLGTPCINTHLWIIIDMLYSAFWAFEATAAKTSVIDKMYLFPNDFNPNFSGSMWSITRILLNWSAMIRCR